MQVSLTETVTRYKTRYWYYIHIMLLVWMKFDHFTCYLRRLSRHFTSISSSSCRFVLCILSTVNCSSSVQPNSIKELTVLLLLLEDSVSPTEECLVTSITSSWKEVLLLLSLEVIDGENDVLSLITVDIVYFGQVSYNENNTEKWKLETIQTNSPEEHTLYIERTPTQIATREYEWWTMALILKMKLLLKKKIHR